MRYLKYLMFAGAIDAVVYLGFGIIADWDKARDIAIVVSPLCLWSARLFVAIRSGKVTRRMPMLDGGPTMKGVSGEEVPRFM